MKMATNISTRNQETAVKYRRSLLALWEKQNRQIEPSRTKLRKINRLEGNVIQKCNDAA